MKFLYIFLFLFIGYSCSSGFGNKLAGKDLDVYYDTKDLQPFADSLGSYWTKNKLIGDRKQSIKLTKDKSVFEVRLIQSTEFKNNTLSPEELVLLQNLQYDLSITIFKGKKMKLLICDDEFNTKFEVK